MLKPMKRILVIDESEVIRETLALILGREFVVVKRPHEGGSLSFSDADSEVDLLILGLSPTIGVESSALLRFAARVPFAVLFLVDSKSVARAIQDRDKIGCLAKPFNPFELKEKVGRLLSRRNVQSKDIPWPEHPQHQLHYLEFPYLGRAAASLVHRFAATKLPLLISGEIGCGQERVARAVHGGSAISAPCVSLNAAEIGTDYLAQKSLEISCHGRFHEGMITLLVQNLEKVLPAGQSALLNFLEEDKVGEWRLLTTARDDLLKKVYQGEFLEALYYKLATLTLKLPPLRDRKEDIPALASWFGRLYAKTVGLGEVTFSADASERLVNYLWFGNLHEMETVVARTLVIRRKRLIEAADLVFDFSEERELELPEFEEFVPSEASPKKELKLVTAHPAVHNRASVESGSGNGHARSVDLHALIHELAHELKNPMVTIKTFAQLLSDRYQDEDFRARFQGVVGDDIERMDDLLETMIEFADFSQPRATKVPLEEKLRTALQEISEECDKRQARFHWKGNGYNREIRIDEAQLQYILRNVLLAILSQAKVNSEIEIDVEKQGCVAISYLREGARVASIGHYFNASSSTAEQSTVPLRILLAKQLVERNGGRMTMDHSNSERDTLRMEFPIV
jgi:DNA-binding NtrC family response regulator